MARKWTVPVLVLVIAGLLVALVISLNREPDKGSAAAARDRPADAASVLERRDPNDPLAAGPVDAPLVLVVFSDYQCGFCARWSADTLPSMRERVAAGDLRIEWRDTNIFGPNSERAARAAYAAALQDKFFQYSNRLFPDGQKRPASELTEEALVELAGTVGLDPVRFKRDMRSERAKTEIARNAKLGLDAGISSTPTFMLGGQRIVGAQPTEVFDRAYNAALQAAQ